MAANPSSDWELYYQHEQNAGWNKYPERVTRRGFVPECSRPCTVASGQVLKAHSFVTSDSAGKMVACGNIAEYAKAVFATNAASGSTIILGGLTLTTSAIMTPAEIVSAFLNQATDKGAFTGTLTGWELVADSNSDVTLYAYATTGLTNVTDFVKTGTSATTVTVTTVNGSTTFQQPEGILAFDVDATSGDVEATIYTEVRAYVSEIVWAVDTAVDKITKKDGTQVACTTYNTGAGTALLKQKVVANTEFEIIIPTAGESLQHG